MAAVSNHQTLQAYKARRPVLSQVSFVAPNASVIGDVTIGQSSSVWYGAILRGAQHEVGCGWRQEQADMCPTGDVNRIKIGSNTTILDNVVIHVAQHNPQDTSAPTIIGDNVTIGEPAAAIEQSA